MASLTLEKQKDSQQTTMQPVIVLQWDILENTEIEKRVDVLETDSENVYIYGAEPKREMMQPKSVLIAPARKSAEWLQMPKAFKKTFKQYKKIAVVEKPAPEFLRYLRYMGITHFISNECSDEEKQQKLKEAISYSYYIDPCLKQNACPQAV